MMLALTEENSYLYISNCEKLKGTVPSVKSSIKTHPAENISIEASNSPELANSASSADSSGMIELVKVWLVASVIVLVLNLSGAI